MSKLHTCSFHSNISVTFIYRTIDDQPTFSLEMTNIATANQQIGSNRKITKITAVTNPAHELGRENPHQPSPQGLFIDASHIEITENLAYVTHMRKHDSKSQPPPLPQGSSSEITTAENHEYEIVTDQKPATAENNQEYEVMTTPSVQESSTQIAREENLLHSPQGSSSEITTAENHEYEIVTDQSSFKNPATAENNQEYEVITPPSVQESSTNPPSE